MTLKIKSLTKARHVAATRHLRLADAFKAQRDVASVMLAALLWAEKYHAGMDVIRPNRPNEPTSALALVRAAIAQAEATGIKAD